MEEGKNRKESHSPLSASFKTGAIALVFLIIGYETALFIHKAAVTRLEANRARPDTVFVVDRALAETILGGKGPETLPETGPAVIRKPSGPPSDAVRTHPEQIRRKVESFRFDPNTVSVEDLVRLGFSGKQAEAIDRYRNKGGRFRRPADFAKSYVVADSVYERLAPYIVIPRIDINRADSAAFETLPGIGPWFAARMVAYRNELGGYSCVEQLMEIYRFDREKFDGLKDLVSCSEAAPFDLWTLPEEELSRHPHLSRAEAHGVVLYRAHQPRSEWTVEGLRKAGVLSSEHALRLSLCRIAVPEE